MFKSKDDALRIIRLLDNREIDGNKLKIIPDEESNDQLKDLVDIYKGKYYFLSYFLRKKLIELFLTL